MTDPLPSSVRVNEDRPCCFRRIRGGGVRLIWEITARCNLRCRHCFVASQPDGVSTEMAFDVVSQFSQANIRKVMFTGGEPFLRNDFRQIVEASARENVLIDITSNLTLIGDREIHELARLGVQEITTSLDGPPEIHDAIRGCSGNFASVVCKIKKLRRAGIEVDVVCVAQRGNAEYISAVIDGAFSVGASSITISGFNQQNAAAAKTEDCCLQPGQLECIAEQIAQRRAHYQDRFPIRTVGLLNPFDREQPCNMRDMMSINARGEVQHCLLAPVPEHERGHISAGLSSCRRQLLHNACCSQSGWMARPKPRERNGARGA